jgi:SAM-dependent methyltransferase
VDEPAILGPGTLDMALPLVNALRLRPGMRVLEVGGGTGQVATILAKAWDVTVFTLEPWHGGEDIQARAAAAGVADRVIALTSRAQELPFAADTFDAVLSINSFEMIEDDRPAALAEMVRVARPGARVGIAEPMCLPVPIPPEIAELDERGGLRFQQCFRSVKWNRDLFTRAGLLVIDASYFPEARRWWLAYEAQATQPGREVERELIRRDGGRWLSLGLVVGEKPDRTHSRSDSLARGRTA